MKTEDRGFSLTELLLVIAVLAALSIFAIPMLNSAMRDIQLNADAKNIATTLTYARTQAASQTTRYRVSFVLGTNRWSMSRFDPQTGQYSLEQTSNTLSDGIANSGITFQAASGTAPAGFENLTQSSTTITFDSRGLPMGASGHAPGIIYLSGNETDYAVSVSLSGKVQVWRLQEDGWATE